MTPETRGDLLALQSTIRALRVLNQADEAYIKQLGAYIVRLEQAVRDLLGVIQRGHIANTDLPMLDLIHQLLDGENDQ